MQTQKVPNVKNSTPRPRALLFLATHLRQHIGRGNRVSLES